MNLSLVTLLVQQNVTLLRVKHLQRATQRMVRHLLGIMTLGKFFAEKVEAGKPEDFRVAAQPLVPPAPVGKQPRQHQRHRQGRKKKETPEPRKRFPIAVTQARRR